jgi:hypothetical protein
MARGRECPSFVNVKLAGNHFAPPVVCGGRRLIRRGGRAIAAKERDEGVVNTRLFTYPHWSGSRPTELQAVRHCYLLSGSRAAFCADRFLSDQPFQSGASALVLRLFHGRSQRPVRLAPTRSLLDLCQISKLSSVWVSCASAPYWPIGRGWDQHEAVLGREIAYGRLPADRSSIEVERATPGQLIDRVFVRVDETE